MLFELKQVQSAVRPNTFTGQEAGLLSNADSTNFWSRVLFTKHSDTTLKLLGKAFSFDFLATFEKHTTDFYSLHSRNRFNSCLKGRYT